MTAPAPSLDTLPLFAQAAGELATEPAALALLPILDAAGVILTTDGARIHYKAPPGALTDGLIGLIRRNKPALIRALAAAGATAELPEKQYGSTPKIPVLGGSGVEEPPAVDTEPPTWAARARAEALADPVITWAVGEIGAVVGAALYTYETLPPDLAAEETALRAEILELEERIERGRALLATETDPGKRTRYQTRINELTARVNTVYDALGALPIDWSSPGGPP